MGETGQEGVLVIVGWGTGEGSRNWGLGVVELDGERCVVLGREWLKFKSGARIWT